MSDTDEATTTLALNKSGTITPNEAPDITVQKAGTPTKAKRKLRSVESDFVPTHLSSSTPSNSESGGPLLVPAPLKKSSSAQAIPATKLSEPGETDEPSKITIPRFGRTYSRDAPPTTGASKSQPNSARITVTNQTSSTKLGAPKRTKSHQRAHSGGAQSAPKGQDISPVRRNVDLSAAEAEAEQTDDKEFSLQSAIAATGGTAAPVITDVRHVNRRANHRRSQSETQFQMILNSSNGPEASLLRVAGHNLLASSQSQANSTSSASAPPTSRLSGQYSLSSTTSQSSLGSAEASETVFEGVLYKLTSTKRWKKRWAVLSRTSLTLCKSRQEKEVKTKVITLNHSTVRDTHEEGKRALELLAQDGNRYFFSTEFENDVAVWLTTMKAVTEELLSAALTNKSDQAHWHSQKEAAVSTELLDLAMTNGNGLCADCNAENPEWTSLTLGVFVCQACCSVHRSFGRNISNIRSVIFDHWDPDQIEALRTRGNQQGNAFWEASVPSKDWALKRRAATSNDDRIKWIFKKYIKRSFVPDGTTNDQIDAKLYGIPAGTSWTALVEQYRISNPLVAPSAAQLPSQGAAAQGEEKKIASLFRNLTSHGVQGVLGNLNLAFHSKALPEDPAAKLERAKRKEEKKAKKRRKEAASVLSEAAAEVASKMASSSPDLVVSASNSSGIPPGSTQSPTDAAQLALLSKYICNPNLLREALLYLLDEDKHFVRQMHIILREPDLDE